ncbi:MAG: hypothetical protein LBJ69_02940 [Holosporales bacterium]|jgi:hypothetical protein|nr:hypothetical protein [Holosporales bacterium]
MKRLLTLVLMTGMAGAMRIPRLTYGGQARMRQVILASSSSEDTPAPTNRAGQKSQSAAESYRDSTDTINQCFRRLGISPGDGRKLIVRVLPVESDQTDALVKMAGQLGISTTSFQRRNRDAITLTLLLYILEHPPNHAQWPTNRNLTQSLPELSVPHVPMQEPPALVVAPSVPVPPTNDDPFLGFQGLDSPDGTEEEKLWAAWAKQGY